MKTTFRVFVTKDISEHSTFVEAFVAFFKAVTELIDQGTSYQVLETFCWIEGIFDFDGKIAKMPLHFNDARDFAYDVGILIDPVDNHSMPTIADPLPEVLPVSVEALFIISGLNELAQLAELKAERANETVGIDDTITIEPVEESSRSET